MISIGDNTGYWPKWKPRTRIEQRSLSKRTSRSMHSSGVRLCIPGTAEDPYYVYMYVRDTHINTHVRSRYLTYRLNEIRKCLPVTCTTWNILRKYLVIFTWNEKLNHRVAKRTQQFSWVTLAIVSSTKIFTFRFRITSFDNRFTHDARVDFVYILITL